MVAQVRPNGNLERLLVVHKERKEYSYDMEANPCSEVIVRDPPESLETQTALDNLKQVLNKKMLEIFGRDRWTTNKYRMQLDSYTSSGNPSVLHDKLVRKRKRAARILCRKYLPMNQRTEATAEAMKGIEQYLTDTITDNGYRLNSMGGIGEELKRRMRDAYKVEGYDKALRESYDRAEAVKQQFKDLLEEAEVIVTAALCQMHDDPITALNEIRDRDIG